MLKLIFANFLVFYCCNAFATGNVGKIWRNNQAVKHLQQKKVIHQQVAHGECATWRQTPEGRLAEIIVLDQLSRNMFRDTPQSFAFDGQALFLAQECIRSGDDKKLASQQRHFAYMPYMHSESLVIQKQSLELFGSLGPIKYAQAHYDIIERFGRFPHRNKILDRTSSDEEVAFLKEPGSSF